MENILEVIPFVLFLVIWAVSKLFFRGKGDSKEGEGDAASSKSASHRAREIQKEIRRRIAQRQGQERGGGPVVAGPFPPQIPTVLKPLQPEGDAQLALDRPLAEQRTEVELRAPLASEIGRVDASRGQKPRRRTIAKRSGGQQEARRLPLWGNFAEQLASDPMARKKAFLYMEIFGAPVSMRRERSFTCFWEQ